jgi:predicted DNA-binding protein (UPF0251 family)
MDIVGKAPDGHYRMKHRTWITEALRLHFEEHLPRVVAGRRLGVPKSTEWQKKRVRALQAKIC